MFNQLCYPQPIEDGIAKIESILSQDYQLAFFNHNHPISKRSVALLLLQNDQFLWEAIQQEPEYRQIEAVRQATQAKFPEPITLVIAQTRHEFADKIEEYVLTNQAESQETRNEWLHYLTVNPITGFPILLLVLYYGIYQFVGVFAGGTLVDKIEGFFETQINPIVNQVTAQLLPWTVLQDLIANDYGIITLGFRYAIAIVLPVVTTFFLMFSLLEDSGYLPRLSLLVDRLFKSIGLSGRAVIPMVLGLGCGTMATLVTRTLETKRERVIATLLLALAIPCSAQLGVILGLLSQSPMALLIWSGFMLGIFITVGFLSAQVLPGQPFSFYMEIPPLRLPRITTILRKTYTRIIWYFSEILPLFVLASVLIWLGKLTGVFDLLISGLAPLMVSLGLPKAAAPIFLYGFFRRDYGAAGMFDLQHQGILTNQQLVVAAITLTLFIPCIAQFQFMVKERGIKTTLFMITFIVSFALTMGYLVNQFLRIMEFNF